MHNIGIFICLLFAVVFSTTCDARGGRGGGGGGRAGGRSSSRGWGGSRRGSVSSSSSSSYPSSHSNSGGHWVNGFFHSTPQYTYRPVYVFRGSSSGSGSTGSQYAIKDEYSPSSDAGYGIGFTISRGLSGDFFSIFNMVRGIAKYPDKIRNDEIMPKTTTTESPIITYSINDAINPTPNFMYNYNEIKNILEETSKKLSKTKELERSLVESTTRATPNNTDES